MSRTLLAVSGLTHSLAHQLRTGLSVIQNELTCLQSMLPPGECERAFQRCRQMARSIREVAQLSAHELKIGECEPVHIDSLIEDAFGLAPQRPPGKKSAPLRADLGKMRQVFSLLSKLFKSSSLSDEIEIAWAMGGKQEALTFRSFSSLCKDTQGFDSLTAFFNLYLANENYHAPLADAILWAHGYATAIEMFATGQVKITLILE